MKYLKQGDQWTPTTEGQLDLRDTLDVGVYVVGKQIMQPYHLERTADFTLPKKLYGNTEKHAKRIISTFNGRSGQTGVLLSGVKGSGKTMLAKYIAVSSGLPTIIVNNSYSDDSFLTMLQGINQKAVIIFDEFEKVYDTDSQERVLTLFDGVFTAQNKIIILTCNNKNEVREFFHNRPTRLRYSIHFDGLETSFIKEYCEDHLQDQTLLDEVLKLVPTCMDFNFDMLQHLVDELNLYGGPVSEVTEILNVKPYITAGPKVEWVISVLETDKPDAKWVSKSTLNKSPMLYFYSRDNIYVSAQQTEPPVVVAEGEDEDADDRSLGFYLRKESLQAVSRDGDTYQFKVVEEGHNLEVLITRSQSEDFVWGTF